MSDLFDYLEWRGDLTFEQSAFCKIDALLLAQISYLKFHEIVPPDFDNQIELSDLAQKFKSSSDFAFRTRLGPGVNARTPELLEKMAASPRFKNITVTAYEEKFNKDVVEQFAAMTFIFGKTSVITFRGTDSSLIGWKEDCNIACLDEIPSHLDGVSYCQKALLKLKTDFILTGHSKGGHLAIYTAVNSGENFQKKIKAVYNFDGPGFSQNFYDKKDFLSIQDCLTNVYPSGSLVGMIFHQPRHYEIVKSTSRNPGQHDPVTWQISGTNFVSKKEFAKESIFFNTSLNKWIETMTVEQKSGFVNSVFKVLEASGFDSTTDISENPVTASANMIKKFTALDKETKDKINSALKVLRQCVKTEIPILKIMNM